MAKYEARLTSAGFIGDVTARLDGAGVEIRGLRAQRPLMIARLVGQWALGFGGILAFALGYEQGFTLIGAAVVYSFVLYLALWWTAVEDSVWVRIGPDTEAKTGWSFRWFDVFWLFNGISMLILLLTASSSGSKTVSFEGPAMRSDRADVRYLLEAKVPVDAAVLVATLLGARVEALDAVGVPEATAGDLGDSGRSA